MIRYLELPQPLSLSNHHYTATLSMCVVVQSNIEVSGNSGSK